MERVGPTPTPTQFEIVKRDVDGERYAHVLTAEDRAYAMDWATRYAREGKPGDVFGVYEQPAGTKPTTGPEPAGRRLRQIREGRISLMAHKAEQMVETLSGGRKVTHARIQKTTGRGEIHNRDS